MLQERSQGALFVLDAGSSLLGAWLSLASDGQVLVEAMNSMGYDALVVGQAELLKGLEVAQARAKEATFPFLSANLVGKQDGKPLFDPYAIVIKQGVRAGIIGISDRETLKMPGMADAAQWLDPQETLRRAMGELQGKVDVIIVLSRLGLEEDATLAAAVPGIQVIVGGKTRRLMREPQRVGNTLVIQQGYNGEWLGHLSATWDAQRTPSDIQVESLVLTDEFADDPAMVKLLDQFKTRYTEPTPEPTRKP